MPTHLIFTPVKDSQRYSASQCGKTVEIVRTDRNNISPLQAIVADECPSCIDENSIDLSQDTFLHFATLDEGEFPIKWRFV
jgi:hypothetical protein